ncbi:hypothetical protein ACHAXA_008164 [Cyclostephanos tholiformis]|uniref:Pseudouridine synthase RsuA/RluA-like domain-containing protein n=1 Tax=Cyclostephanos tholiformis TaxID=382380 RepID=A0ABD3RCC5_9STRA
MMRSRNVILSLLPAASTSFGFGKHAASSFSYEGRVRRRNIAVHRHPTPSPGLNNIICTIANERNRRCVRGESLVGSSSGTRKFTHPRMGSMPDIVRGIRREDGETRTNVMTLSDIMKESYRYHGETDGVRDALISRRILADLSAEHDAAEVASRLIRAAIDAAGTDRGCLAGMINALLASCCGNDDDDAAREESSSTVHPEISLAILDLVDGMHSMDPTTMVTPDIVSLSLAYRAIGGGEIAEFATRSNAILDRARRMAKKTAGSHRRRALASERRGGRIDTIIDAKRTEDDLQSIYGRDIRVLHETTDLIVISKPAGMVCYHAKRTGAGKITPSRKKRSIRASSIAENDANDPDGGSGIVDGGARRMDISLVDALLDCSVTLSTLNPIARGIVHRLDRGTSGCIVLAKTDEIHMRLIASFFLRRSEKRYLALVPGCSTIRGSSGIVVGDEDGSGTIEERKPQLSLGSSGVIDSPVDGRPARSSYRVTRVFGKEDESTSSSSDALLLEVTTLTGRKHQVRAHCASLGHPIFLDPLYASSSILVGGSSRAAEKGQKRRRVPSEVATDDTAEPALPRAIVDAIEKYKFQQERFFLHAASLSIREVCIFVNAPLPQWWIDTIDQLN